MKIVAFIFARGNSKGIKNKNLLKFKKTTLLGHAIQQAKKVNYIKEVFLSTDSKKILNYAQKYKIKTPFLRPRKLSTDNSSEVDAWRHAIKYLREKLDLRPDYIVSIPTTCPLRKISDINLCLEKALRNKLDIVFTAMKSSRNPYFNMIGKKKNKINIISRFLTEKKNYFYTAKSPECFDLTTACYIFKPDYIMNTKDLFSGKTDFIEIPRKRGIDIDDKFDYELIKLFSKK